MIILSNKDAHEVVTALLDYSLDIGNKSLNTTNPQARGVYNAQLCKVLDTILIITKKLYTPKNSRVKKIKDN